MSVELKKEGNTLSMLPLGRMDERMGEEIPFHVRREFTRECSLLQLDFSHVDYISADGVRAMFSICRNLNGRRMELLHANAAIREVIAATGFLEVFGVKDAE